MANLPVQQTVHFNGQRYAGIYSVAGNLMIARIPGIGSRSRAVDGADAPTLASTMLEEILRDAQVAGRPAD